jgi:copper(I)-binding protein
MNASAKEERMGVGRGIGVATVVALLGALLAGCGAPSGPSIKVEDAWARQVMVIKETGQPSEGVVGMAGTGAVFMRLLNEGREADRLVGGQTDVADFVQIHETVIQGDVVLMQMLPGGVQVPARGEVLLKPGSYHIMLVDLQRDLKVGDRFTVELWFLQSDNLSVEVEVREP